jgi:hypothetical protein
MTTNDVTARTASTAIAALGNLRQGLATVKDSIPAAGGEPILRMGRDGSWVFGADNAEMEDGSEWAANPFSLQHGYICWKKRPEGSKEPAEKLGDILLPMTQQKPLRTSLPDYGESKWQDQISITFRCLSGEDEGTQVVYKPSSIGGASEMKDFIDAIMKQIDTDPQHPVPVVVFGSDTYNHTTWGKTYTPVLEIVEWVSMEDATPADEPEQAPTPEPVKEAAPATAQRTSRRAAAPETAQEEQRTEPAKEADAPAAESGERRRRRRAA